MGREAVPETSDYGRLIDWEWSNGIERTITKGCVSIGCAKKAKKSVGACLFTWPIPVQPHLLQLKLELELNTD